MPTLVCLLGRLACVMSVTLNSPVQQATAPAQRPNIVVILADDMGFSDIGCYGSEIATPNLDRLAAGGLRFTQFYNAARCCPTRASLMTGLYPHQAGIGHMVEDRGHPSYRGFLNDRCVTIAEVLRDAGYRTFMAGKWHVGEQRPHWPVDRGFDRSYSLISGATNYFRLDPERRLARDDQPIQPDPDWYITDAISDNAVSFIAQHAQEQGQAKPEAITKEQAAATRPFFLYVAYTAPHWPLHALQPDIQKYLGTYRIGWDTLRRNRHRKQIELGLVKSNWSLSPRDPEVRSWDTVPDPEDRDLRMAVYAAQIDRMDQGIGKILAAIEQANASANTLILFLADNGGCAEIINQGRPAAPAGTPNSFLSYGVGWANASNTPFRLYKHYVHEGGISSPLIVHWPNGVVGKSRLVHEPSHLIDIMATCVDVAGARYPSTRGGLPIQPMEGRSLQPLFHGRDNPPERALFWEHEGNRAVRKGDWKLVARFRRPWELYDIAADRTELNNLAEQRPDMMRELAALHDEWSARCGILPWQPARPAGAAKKKAAGQP